MIHPRLTLATTALTTAALLAACAGAAPTTAPATTLPTVEVVATTAPTEAATEAPPAATPTDAGVPVTDEPVGAVTGLRAYSFDPSQSSASYSVDEYFLQESNRLGTAVGVSSEISGDLQINFDDPTSSPLGTVTVDISLLRSDSNQRDNAIRRQWLESSTYPLATFTATEIQGLAGTPSQGQTVTFKLVGDMTVRETTLPVTWDVTATLDGETLKGTATTEILMADFGVEPPSNPFISVTDGVVLTLNYVLLPSN